MSPSGQCFAGPILFTIYTLPVGDIIHGHNSDYHLYAIDSQLHLACDPTATPSNILTMKACLEACIANIWCWMPLNEFTLNDNKTGNFVSTVLQKRYHLVLSCGYEIWKLWKVNSEMGVGPPEPIQKVQYHAGKPPVGP